MENIFSKCDKCGNDIKYGESHVSFNRYLEYAEYVAIRKRIESQVIDGLELLTLCEPCGNAFDKIISKMIKEFSENK